VDAALRDRTRRLWPAGSFSTEDALALKAERLTTVVIPARDEAATVGAVVGAVHTAHGRLLGSGLVDEIVVVDDGSSDGTARAARAAGARVRRLHRSGGKGRAMAEGAKVAGGDLVVFLDADVLDTDPAWVPQLLGPLLLDESIELVKAFYERPLEGRPTGGGRVTQLAARPILSLLFPDLGGILQPLVDVARRSGASAIAQVDLGVRTHRNRPLSELGPMARDVLAVALARAGVPTASS